MGFKAAGNRGDMSDILSIEMVIDFSFHHVNSSQVINNLDNNEACRYKESCFVELTFS